MYRQNRYAMPKGTYEPGRKVRIEANEETERVRFYDLKTNAVIDEYPLANGVGKSVRNNHPERDKFSKLQSIKDKVFAGFTSDEGTQYVQMIIEAKPRYVRDQLGILLKLIDSYTSEDFNMLYFTALTDRSYLQMTFVIPWNSLNSKSHYPKNAVDRSL